jgi:hypothetical protein
MPPRHAYWTILIDNQPTAFRAHDPEELVPTLNRLREKNASAVMKWFERGQLFDSRDQAREAGLGKGERRWEGPRPPREEERADGPRDRNWRPGGEHRDPRQRYKDAKKAKWNRFKEQIRQRHDERLARDPERFSPPHGDPLRDRFRGDRRYKPFRETREESFPEGAPTRPHGDKYRDQRPRPQWRSREDDRRPDWSRDSRPDRADRARPGDRDRRADRTPRPRHEGPPRDDRDRYTDRNRYDSRKRYDDRNRDSDRHRDDDRQRSPRRDDRREWKPKGPGGAANKVAAKRPFGKKPFGKKPFAKKPFASKPFGKKPFGKKPLGKKPFAKTPLGAKPGGRRRRRDDDE